MVELAMRCPYEDRDLVVQVPKDWIEYMLHNIGVLDSKVESQTQSAIRRFALTYAAPVNGMITDLTMGELEMHTHSFWTGYAQARVDAGLQQADGRNTFPLGEGVEG